MSRFILTVLQFDQPQLEALIEVLESEWGPERDLLQPIIDVAKQHLERGREMNDYMDEKMARHVEQAASVETLDALWEAS